MVKLNQVNIVGHTNVGKTTLMQNIANKYIGIIDNCANSTIQNQYYYDNMNNILYVDTSGFQLASTLLYNYNKTGSYNYAFNKDNYKNNIISDLRCVRALESGDLTYYIVSPDKYIPEQMFEDEIEIISLFSNNILGIINLAEVNMHSVIYHKRVELWRNFFVKYNIDYVESNFNDNNNIDKIILLNKTTDKLSYIDRNHCVFDNIDSVASEIEYQYYILQIKFYHINKNIPNYDTLVCQGAKLYHDIFKFNLILKKYHQINKFDDVMNMYNACWINELFNFCFDIESSSKLAYDIHRYINII